MSSQITKYKLIRGGPSYIPLIEKTVNEMIVEGWQPVGDLKMYELDKQTMFCQQMEFRMGVSNDVTS